MEDVPPAAKRQCMQPPAEAVITGCDDNNGAPFVERLELQLPVMLSERSQQPQRCSTPLPEDKEEEKKLLNSCGDESEASVMIIKEVNGEAPTNYHDELEQQVLDELNESMQSFIDEVEEEEMEAMFQDFVSNEAARETDSEQPVSVMECLPNELLEDVFVWIPLIELFASCRLVSRRWNEVISREKFLYWKKSYYQVKSRYHPVVTSVDRLILTHKLMPAPGTYVTILPNVTMLRLARFVADKCNHPDIDLTKMEEIMTKHPQYSCVKEISQLQQTVGKKCLTAIESLVLLVTCCTSVHQVLHLVFLLNTPQNGGLSSPVLTHTQLTEIMFCLATFFYSLWIKNVLPPRFHYYVYYAMNVLERSAPSALLPFSNADISAAASVSQPLCPPVPLTSEQMMIVNHPYRPGETVKVIAFAGTGKTATLVELARRHPEKKFLYCVYNKSVQQYAENQVFGKRSNVSCRTFHSLAFMKSYVFKLIRSSLKPNNITKLLKMPPPRKNHFTETVLCTLITFFASADMEICEKHISDEMFESKVINHSIPKKDILREARQIWERMKNVDDKEAKVTHDAYLKMFQLRNEIIKDNKRLRGRNDYDMILVDEAQDLTPAIVAILKRQPHAMVYVGDPHQSIYRFRGAVNAIASVDADYTYSLTRSFRFGPEIAYVGSLLLSVLKQVKSRTLVGGLQTGTICGDRCGQVAVIARTNLILFDEIVKVILSTDRSRKKLAFAGGMEGYDFNVLLDILKLKKGARPSSLTSYIQYFKSYQALKRYAERAWHDPAMMIKINICEKYGDRLPGLIEKMKEHNCNKLANADIVFSTAHKSKGLEFETVVVADDFLSRVGFADMSHIEIHKIDEDERHLLYVAATRAKKHLVMSKALHQVLQQAKEPFIYPTGPGNPSQQGQVECTICKMLHRLPELRLNIKRFTLNDGTVKKGGVICRFCGANKFPALLYASALQSS